MSKSLFPIEEAIFSASNQVDNYFHNNEVLYNSRKFIKIFKPFIHHPKLGLGLLVGIVFVIGSVKYGHQLTGAAGFIAKTVNVAVRGLFTAGALLIRGIGKTIRPIGTAISFVPTAIVKTVNGARAVVYFIFHPLQAMGFTKVSTS